MPKKRPLDERLNEAREKLDQLELEDKIRQLRMVKRARRKR